MTRGSCVWRDGRLVGCRASASGWLRMRPPRAVRCVLPLLVATPLLLLLWQHGQLESVRLSPTKARGVRRPPPLRQPAHTQPRDAPPSPPRRAVDFEDGEYLGNVSQARLCVVMPVRSNSLQRAVRNVQSWSSARGMPCVTEAAPVADLCIFHSQSFVSARDVQLASDLLRTLHQPFAATATSATAPRSPAACFGAVRFLAARIPLDVDVYTIYPTHNFTGPNTHFLSTFAALERISTARLARYSFFQLMESDTYAFRPGWAEALGGVARRRRKEWVLGSRSMCLRPTEVEHINGNAMYANERSFEKELTKELSKRFDSWAFDVLIGRWLLRRHPQRIRESAHILSISTFQRNRSCCELVQNLISRGAGEKPVLSAELGPSRGGVPPRDAWPGLYLLHTGNIGKLRDSTVPPSMRVYASAA